MQKFKEVNLGTHQQFITNFFPKHKGPLQIECKNIITKAENDRLAKLYKRRGRNQSVNNTESSDCAFIKTEVLNTSDRCTRPLSPKIILTTDNFSVHFGNIMKSESHFSNTKMSESPSKKQRREMAIIGDLTVTKSKRQIKEIKTKVSRTLQMSQSTNVEIEKDTVTELASLSERSVACTTIEDFLVVDVLEENDNLSKITNHINIIDDIIDNTTKTHLSILLFNNEMNLLESFQGLGIYQKYFSCKLFTHKVKWYSGRKFAENINLPVTLFELKQIIARLQEKSIIKSDYSCEPTVHLLNLLGLDDVKSIHDSLRLKTRQKKKTFLINAILNYINNQTTLHPTISLDAKVRQMIADKLSDGVHITPLFYTTFYKVHLLYAYTNPEFDIPSGLYRRIYDIKYGNVLHPYFKCENQTVFMNNLEFDGFYRAFSYKTEVIQALEKKGDIKFTTMFDLSKEIVKEFTNLLNGDNNFVQDKPNHLKRFTAGYQYASALWILSKHLSGKYPSEVKAWLKILLEQTQFYQKRRGLWYSHLSMVYKAHLKDYDKGIETLLSGLKDKEISPVDAADIVYRARSYCNKKKFTSNDLHNELLMWKESIPYPEDLPSITINALANNTKETAQSAGYKYMDANGDLSYMNVEQISIRHYIDKEGFTNGIHCEGALAQTIFYVLFWDIIYTDDIPYTFICKMQYLPLDFYSEGFYHSRKAKIDRRLTDIQCDWSVEEYRAFVMESWNCISTYKSLFVLDHIKDSDRLYQIITCIGRNVVSGICQQLVKNFRDYRAGMPDLFVYKEGNCKFVEVKGPGDKLSTKQKLWIRYLLSIGATTEVCYVSKIGNNGKSKNS